MIDAITSHPQFWMVLFLAWGITSDVLGSTKAVKANGVTQLLMQIVTRMLADRAKSRH